MLFALMLYVQDVDIDVVDALILYVQDVDVDVVDVVDVVDALMYV